MFGNNVACNRQNGDVLDMRVAQDVDQIPKIIVLYSKIPRGISASGNFTNSFGKHAFKTNTVPR